MKRNLLLFLLFFLAAGVYSQKQANVWYFGNHAGLDFSSGHPVALEDGQMSTQEGCTTISDKDGKLLFYSDGIKVWNKNHQLMKYTDGSLANDLKGNSSSTQSGLIVPNPSDADIYYLFTVGTKYTTPGTSPNPGFNYYTVDMSKNGGLGKIVAGPVDLSGALSQDWSEKITAVQGYNCGVIWVLSIVENTFKAYKVTASGVNTIPVSSTVNYTPVDIRGYLKVSPDSKKVALADFSHTRSFGVGNGKLVLFNFDNKTGRIANQGTRLTNPSLDGTPYGVAFSRQSKKLYASTYDGINDTVFQFDLTASNVASTKTQIHSQQGYRGALQLATDGKIYASIPREKYLDAIDNPDADKANVSYIERAVSLGSKIANQGLPPFIQSYFTTVNIKNPDTNEIISDTPQTFCIGDTYNLTPESTSPGATYTWTKGDRIIGHNASLTIDNNNFGSGVYQLEIKTTIPCRLIKGKVTIAFAPKPTVKNVVYQQCDVDANPIDGFTLFNLKNKISELSANAPNVKIQFFESVLDLNNNTPIADRNLANYTNTTAFSQTLKVKITNKTTKCYQIGELTLKVNSSGLTAYPDMTTCEIDKNSSNLDAVKSEGIAKGSFNFDTEVNKIINTSAGVFSRTTHNFEFYRNATDATLQKNKLTKPYKSYLFSNNTSLFVRIINKRMKSCAGVGEFKLVVNKLPIPKGDTNTIYLCLNNPVDVPQLKTVVLNGNTDIADDTYQWYRNGTKIAGATQAIYMANKGGTYKVEAFRMYNGATGACKGYNTFIVKVSNKALVSRLSVDDDVNNSEDNAITILVSGLGSYEYAINSKSFVVPKNNLTHTFGHLKTGGYNIAVRDKNGCGTTISKEITAIHFQRFFTPNNDGYFDTWKLLGVNSSYYRSLNIQIFDRYGKIFAILNKTTNQSGWDGRYNGNPLPASDYWYKAMLIDKNGNRRRKLGHFSLIKK